MKFKLKLIGIQIFIFVCMSLTLPLNLHSDNAVEKTPSVLCENEVTYNRGLIEECNINSMSIEPTVTPTYVSTEIPNNKSELETPVAGITLCSINENVKTYSEEDLELLAGIIESEAGSDFCKNSHQRAVCSVVINRVKSDYFPDTIKEVIYQKGQYAIRKQAFNNPSKRAYKNAKYVLEHGSTLPDNCIFQSEFEQGDGVYTTFETPISITYICYKD